MRLLALPCLVLAMSQLGGGANIQLKAALAQQLIAAAWADEDRGAKPWPWADTHPVARLEVPAHGVDLYVLAGGQGNALAFGPGLDHGSSQPGEPGVGVIGGHRDTHFAFLEHVEPGDALRLTGKDGRQYDYVIADTQIADIRRGPLRAAGDGLVLVTCFPFDALTPGGPLRYLVVARPQF